MKLAIVVGHNSASQGAAISGLAAQAAIEDMGLTAVPQGEELP